MCEEEKKYIYDSIKNNEIDHQLIKSYIIANNIKKFPRIIPGELFSEW